MRDVIKEAAIQIGSGGSAGFAEVCLMHPLDLIKTRLQLQQGKPINRPEHYSGLLDCVRKIYRNEGFWSYYKGIVPPILAETPKRAVKFFTFEQYKEFFLFGSSTPTPVTFSMAGLGAGITEAILVNPFEVIKVTLQSNRATGTQVLSTWIVTKDILTKHGFGSQGLFKGVSATIWRNGLFNMVYFGFYHSVKGWLPSHENPLQEFLQKVLIGFISGSLASCINIPFDVAKSRIQGPQPLAGQIKYTGTFQSLALVYREEGYLALYKGLVPKVMRLGPGGAIMLVVYDYVHLLLTDKFDTH